MKERIASVIIAAAQFGDWVHPFWVTVIFIVANNIDGMVIAPKIVGDSVGLHPLTVIISVLAWSLILGGLLGVVQALLLIGIAIIILASYFGLPTARYVTSEVLFLRDTWDAISRSAVGTFYIDTLIPIFIGLSGPLVPVTLRQQFAR